jgi:hypothetical protein
MSNQVPDEQLRKNILRTGEHVAGLLKTATMPPKKRVAIVDSINVLMNLVAEAAARGMKP